MYKIAPKLLTESTDIKFGDVFLAPRHEDKIRNYWDYGMPIEGGCDTVLVYLGKYTGSYETDRLKKGDTVFFHLGRLGGDEMRNNYRFNYPIVVERELDNEELAETLYGANGKQFGVGYRKRDN